MNFKDLPHQEHADFLDDMEIMAGEAYDFAVSKMIDEIMSNLHSENLTKSKDDKKLRRGWTGRVSRVEVDIDSVLDKTLGRYLKALKYILLGKAAGLDAKKAAEDIGLTKKIIPGILQSSYLHSIDRQRDRLSRRSDHLRAAKPDASDQTYGARTSERSVKTRRLRADQGVSQG